MTLKDFFENYIIYLKGKNYSEKTIYNQRRILQKNIFPYLGNKLLQEIKISDTHTLLCLLLQRGHSVGIRGMSTLRSYLKFLEILDIKLPFSWHSIEVPKTSQKSEPVILEDHEIQQIRNYFNLDDSKDIRTLTLFELLLCSGLRISEALSLNKSDINFEKKEVVFFSTKSKRIEKVYINGVSALLKLYLSLRKDNNPALFVGNTKYTSKNYTLNANRLTARRARSLLHKIANELNMPHLRWHTLRRTFCTTLFRSGLDIKRVQSLARHVNERTTIRSYIAFDKKHDAQEHKKVFAMRPSVMAF